jgi:aminopeptidase N
VISFFNQETGLDLTPVFYQYLKHQELPMLEVQIDSSKKVKLRWKTTEPHFQLPVEINLNGKNKRFTVGNDWLPVSLKTKSKLTESNFNQQKFFYQLNIVR